MAMQMTESGGYGVGKNILAMLGDNPKIGAMHPRASAGSPGNAVLEGGRWIVKAGTIFPSNDSKAVGVVFHDYDVTDGDKAMSVLIGGVVMTAALPEQPSAAANSALKDIQFVPLSSSEYASRFLEGVVPVAVGAVAASSIVLTLAQGVEFVSKEEAEKAANWTIGLASTLFVVTSITLTAPNQVTFVLTPSAAAVAGDVTALASDAIISNGQAPAVKTIITVA